MKSILVIAALYLVVLMSMWFGFYHAQPKIRAHAPFVRQSNYVLNHRAIITAKKFTVLISAEGFGGVERGTGILLDPRHVLTCAHVAEAGNEEFLVYPWPGDRAIVAKPVLSDRYKDLAIMELSEPVDGMPKPVFEPIHSDGEPITIIGNILGSMKWFVGYGIVSGDNGKFVYTDGLVLGGDSGGPWINDKGEIVAISDWGLVNAQGTDLGINGGVSSAVVKTFLHDWKHPVSLLQLLMGGN